MTQETIVAISDPLSSPLSLPPLLLDAALLACEVEELVEELVGSAVGEVEVIDLIEVIQDDVVVATDDIVEAVVLANVAVIGEGEVVVVDLCDEELSTLIAAVELDGVATVALGLCVVGLAAKGVVLEATAAVNAELLPLPLSSPGVPSLQSTLHDCTPAA